MGKRALGNEYIEDQRARDLSYRRNRRATVYSHAQLLNCHHGADYLLFTDYEGEKHDQYSNDGFAIAVLLTLLERLGGRITPALLTEEQKHAIGNLSRRASSPQHADSPKESVSTRGPATIPACTSPPSLSPLPSPPAVRSPVPATPGPPSGPAHALASPNNFPDISAISEPITIPTNEPILPPSTRAPAATFAAAPYTPPAFRPPPHLAEMPFYTPPRPTRPRVTTRRSTSSVSRLRILQSIQPVPYSQTLMKSPEGNLVTPEALHEYGLGVA